ncbi:unnamed protein product [Symbiodinium necroappetens]|uniref:EF-hand domain-containing protein n=2 Tax=Symbiodinium TaxID=2949 RepID=A0A812KPR0_9DINO|nr:Calmodulin [Symbiodinium microadriaticum]CAE7233726.1 unnamed protein product [Symbiodinium necroappetens]
MYLRVVLVVLQKAQVQNHACTSLTRTFHGLARCISEQNSHLFVSRWSAGETRRGFAMAGAGFEIKLDDPEAELSQDQYEKVVDNFKLLDQSKTGRLNPQQVGILFRAFGQNPTDEELAEMLRPVPQVGLDVDGFIRFFKGNYRTPTTEDTLLKAFQVFDLEDTGIMSREKFKEMLTSLGDPMQEHEVDAILREAEVDDKGLFDYKSLAKRLCEGPKRIPDMP